jgi:hypothetical protein
VNYTSGGRAILCIFIKRKTMHKILTLVACLCCIHSFCYTQNALSFDGEDDYVQTDYSGVLGASDRTFEAWIYIDTDAPTSNMAILDYGLNQVGSRNTFIATGSGILRYISGGTNANISSSTNIVPIGEWVHVAFVLKDAKGYLYVNGISVSTGDLSTVNTPVDNESVKIGERVAGGSIPFHGKIDEVRIWEEARSQDQIQTSMMTALCTPPSSLGLYMPFNEGDAEGDNSGVQIAEDLGLGSYTGTLNNFSLFGVSSNWVAGVDDLADGSSFASLEVVTCNSYYWEANGIDYDASGVYEVILEGANVNGCDSIITLELTIDELDDEVTLTNGVLTATATDVSYQWIDCATNEAISGEIGQSFEPNSSGEYSVEISNTSCTITSDCIAVTPVNTKELVTLDQVKVFPNPSSGHFFLDFQGTHNKFDVEILDTFGRCIWSKTYIHNKVVEVDFEGAPGLYSVLIRSGSERYAQPLIKL